MSVNKLPLGFHLGYSLEHRLPKAQSLKTVGLYLCDCGEWEDRILAADAGYCHDSPNLIHINIYVIFTLQDDISAKLNRIGDQLSALLMSKMESAFVRLSFEHICTLSPDESPDDPESKETLH